ncbi:hypothetical protein GGI43DRAFT_414860 [Trichoderma evansii]
MASFFFFFFNCDRFHSFTAETLQRFITKVETVLFNMTTVINRPVFKELAKIQKDIGFPPSPRLSEYDKCRSYVKGSTVQCNKAARKNIERDELDVLLFEFRHMTECGRTDNFYNKIERYITLTHCYIHYQKAYKAFIQWKTQRIAATPILFSDPAKGATSSSDSLGAWSQTSYMASPTPTSPISGTSGYDGSASDLCIGKEVKHSAIEANAANAASRMSDDSFDEIEKLRDRLNPLGTVTFPNAGKKKDNLKIFKIMEKPLPPATMAKEGILYIYEHTSIPGIFKIGFSTQTAEERHKQPGNCYQVNTRIIYESKEPFMGARQAERIVHVALADTNFHVHNCPHCTKRRTHKEWFITSEKQARTKVRGAESWLRLPAYILTETKFELTPEGQTIYNSKTRFSISELHQHINGDDISDNVSDVLSAEKLATNIRQICIPRSSSPVNETELLTAQVDGSFTATNTTTTTTTTPKRQEPRKVSVVRKVGKSSKEALELAHKYQLPSKNLGNDETYSQAKESWALALRQPKGSSLEVNNDEEYDCGTGSRALVLKRSNEANLELHSDEEYSQAEGSWALALRQPNDAKLETENEKEHIEAKESWALALRRSKETNSEIDNDGDHNHDAGYMALALRRPNEANLEIKEDILNLFKSLLPAEPLELRAVPIFHNQ